MISLSFLALDITLVILAPPALPLRHPMHKIRLLGFGAVLPKKAYAIFLRFSTSKEPKPRSITYFLVPNGSRLRGS
jgi:hypothetical protein